MEILRQADPGPVRKDNAAITGQDGIAVGMDITVSIRTVAVETEQMDAVLVVLVILLAEHISIYIENPYVPILQGVSVDVDGGAVHDIGLHAVSVDFYGKVGVEGNVTTHLDIFKILSKGRGGVSSGSGGKIQRNDARVGVFIHVIGLIHPKRLLPAALLLRLDPLALFCNDYLDHVLARRVQLAVVAGYRLRLIR